MNLINSVGWNLYVNEKLMSFNNNNKTGFTDYSGNIVIEPKYSSALMISGNSYIIFFGRVAYIMERQVDGVSKKAFLKTDGTVKYVEDLVKTSDKNEIKNISVEYGFYIVETETLSSHKMTYYAFDGTLLKEFDISDDNSVDKLFIADKDYAVETTATETI